CTVARSRRFGCLPKRRSKNWVPCSAYARLGLGIHACQAVILLSGRSTSLFSELSPPTHFLMSRMLSGSCAPTERGSLEFWVLPDPWTISGRDLVPTSRAQRCGI